MYLCPCNRKNESAMAHLCDKCPIRAKYDRNPRSLIGRLWRWHISFCPGWKKYFRSLDPAAQAELRNKYGIK